MRAWSTGCSRAPTKAISWRSSPRRPIRCELPRRRERASEATKPSPDPRILAWLRRHETQLVVDSVILGEIRFGILLLPNGARRERLEHWFDNGIGRIHCLPWGPATGMRWAQLLADLRSRGRAMPIKDSMIAATSLFFGMALATLNVLDFEPAQVELVDPTA